MPRSDAGRLVTLSGSAAIAGLEPTERVERVFNIEVGLAHTYLVGYVAAWVHNVDCNVPNGDKIAADYALANSGAARPGFSGGNPFGNGG